MPVTIQLAHLKGSHVLANSVAQVNNSGHQRFKAKPVPFPPPSSKGSWPGYASSVLLFSVNLQHRIWGWHSQAVIWVSAAASSQSPRGFYRDNKAFCIWNNTNPIHICIRTFQQTKSLSHTLIPTQQWSLPCICPSCNCPFWGHPQWKKTDWARSSEFVSLGWTGGDFWLYLRGFCLQDFGFGGVFWFLFFNSFASLSSHLQLLL